MCRSYQRSTCSSVSPKAENAPTYPANGVAHARRNRDPHRLQKRSRSKMTPRTWPSLMNLKSVCLFAPIQWLTRDNIPAILMLLHIGSDMFTQIDVLSLPGAGLRHLDFPQVSSMFQGYYTGGSDPSQVSLDLMSSSLSDTQCFVRTYGSEPEM